MATGKHSCRLRFGLRTLLVLISIVTVGIAVYQQWGRGPFAQYRAKQWVLDIGGTITYTYHDDARHVRVTIPRPTSGRSYEPSEVLCIRAIRGLTEVSLWGHEFVFSDEGDGRLKDDQFHVDWERFEEIINQIEQLNADQWEYTVESDVNRQQPATSPMRQMMAAPATYRESHEDSVIAILGQQIMLMDGQFSNASNMLTIDQIELIRNR